MRELRPPAVAVMAKVPGAEPVKSRLYSVLTPEEATNLYRCFLLDRLDAVGRLAGICPVVAFTPADAEGEMRAHAPVGYRLLPQRGADLGARLSTLLTGLLEDGHAGAIAIDSDSPTLPMPYVAEAARILETASHDVVLGPCDDGGYYLIGLSSSQPGLFDGIPWSTDAVFRLTRERAQGYGLSVHVLPRWFDVDTEADLRRVEAELTTSRHPSPRTYAFLREWRRARMGGRESDRRP